MDIDGAVVVITGVRHREATVIAASWGGARLVLDARREDRISRLAGELDDAIALRCDVTDGDQVAHTVRAAPETFGCLDVVVNNAGYGLNAPIEDIDVDVDEFRTILELNTVALLVSMQVALPLMRKRDGGSVVDVSSGAIFSDLPETGAYSASKAGLSKLSAIARVELADAGIAVSTVYPFVTSTEFSSSLRGELGFQPRPRAAAPRVGRRDHPRPAAHRAAQADLVPAQFGGSYQG